MEYIQRLSSKFLIDVVSYGSELLFWDTQFGAKRGDYSRARKRIDLLGNSLHSGVKRQTSEFKSFDAVWFTPTKSHDSEVILYCHGGGNCIGSYQSHTGVCSMIAKHTQRKVLAFNYRLAPEHPYPCQIEDGLLMYQELLQSGLQGENIHLAGDSSGGAMVLALAQTIRDQSLPLPKSIVAICPWYDFEVRFPLSTKIIDPSLRPEAIVAYGKASFKQNAKKHSLVYKDFTQLPPIYLLIGGGDTLHDEERELAKRLERDNPNGRSEIWQDMPHVWIALPFLKEAKLGAQAIKKFLDAPNHQGQLNES